ncbi:MAG: tetratricopeptide repeat protein [bacterium]|jgi:tetratricopeptide (TPR) repeat protein
MKKRKPDHSIMHVLREDTLISSEISLQVFQEDLKVAEKERLQTLQNRKELLESLRKSFTRITKPRKNLFSNRDEFVRIIRDGAAFEIILILKQIQRELGKLRNQRMISNTTERIGKSFSDQVSMFIRNKGILEKLEKRLNTLSPLTRPETQPGSTVPPTLDEQVRKTNQIIQLASALREKLLQMIEGIITSFETLENQIQNDLNEEKRIKLYFSSGIAHLPLSGRTSILDEYKHKYVHASYYLRMKFYKSVVEWMVKDNSEIAGCIHALARNRARENMKMKSYQQAAAELCFALHLWKEDPRTYRLLAQVLIQLQDERKAIIALHEVLRLVPDDLSLRKRIANYGIRTGNIDIAITQFREILARNPQEMESRLSLGKILFSEEKYAEIPEILLPYQEQYPDHIECNRLLGITWGFLGEWKGCIGCLQKILNSTELDIQEYSFLSLSFRKLHLSEEAIGVLEKGLHCYPDSSILHISLGAIYQERGDWHQAEQHLCKALDTTEKSPSILAALGKIQIALNRSGEAVQTLEQAYQLDASRADVLLDLCTAYRSRNQMQQAVHLLEEGIRKFPEDQSIKQELMVVYTEMGAWDKAALLFS